MSIVVSSSGLSDALSHTLSEKGDEIKVKFVGTETKWFFYEKKIYEIEEIK